ncbi:unnamed protein product [Notodromas monacha]|uniref:Uncharacterized protein n=1 Tax=Notodromas monacha TaxID=399045 RepID=A0A7R9BXC0_9CRUS|nr:unnamed protein product [Notodromas monacha]CAG0923522.1 unnamed protein product [Notodromas monacha]
MARHQGGFLHYDDGDKALCSEPLPAQYQLRVPHLNVHKKVSCDTRTASTTERFEDTYDSLETLDQPTSKLLTCPDIFESHLNDAVDYRRNFKRKLPSVSESSLASRLSAVSANPTVHKFSQTLLEMIAAVNQKRDALESKLKRKERVQWDTRLVTTTENAYDVLWYPVTLVAIAVVLPLVYAARRRD